jgi:hypothetical protein
MQAVSAINPVGGAHPLRAISSGLVARRRLPDSSGAADAYRCDIFCWFLMY